LSTIRESTIWNLFKSMTPLIQSKLSWVSCNGKSINLWSESILMNPSLESIDKLIPLKSWFMGNGCQKLLDIMEWSEEGRWKGWKNIPSLEGLADKVKLFFKLLTRCTLIDPNMIDD